MDSRLIKNLAQPKQAGLPAAGKRLKRLQKGKNRLAL